MFLYFFKSFKESELIIETQNASHGSYLRFEDENKKRFALSTLRLTLLSVVLGQLKGSNELVPPLKHLPNFSKKSIFLTKL